MTSSGATRRIHHSLPLVTTGLGREMADIISQLILESVQPGAILLGGIAASMYVLHQLFDRTFNPSCLPLSLYGISCLQVYMFFYKNTRDSWYFKLFVSLSCHETSSVCSSEVDIWTMVMKKYDLFKTKT